MPKRWPKTPVSVFLNAPASFSADFLATAAVRQLESPAKALLRAKQLAQIGEFLVETAVEDREAAPSFGVEILVV